MKLSKFLSGSLYGCLILVLVLFSLFGESSLINEQSILWIVLIVALLLFMLAIRDRTSEPLIFILVLTTEIWYIFRFLVLITWPEVVGLQEFHTIEVHAMNRGLNYLFWGTLLCGLGFRFGSTVILVKENGYKEEPPPLLHYITLQRVMIFAILALLAHIFLYMTIGVGRTIGEELSKFGWLFRFINLDIFFLIIIVIVGESWSSLSRKSKIFVLCFFIIFVFSRILLGSRSALYIIIVYWFMFKITNEGNLKIERKHLSLALFIVIISIVAFPIATGTGFIRNVGYSEVSLYDLLEKAEWTRFGFADLLSMISYRLAALDRLVVIVGDYGLRSELSEYVNLPNLLKMIVNATLPGEPFPETILTSRTFGIIYYGWSLSDVKYNYTSSMWTLFGILYAYFGWLGGLVCTFIASFLLAVAYRTIRSMRSKYGLLISTWVLFEVYMCLLSFGFDHMYEDVYSYLLIGTLYIILLRSDSIASRLIFRRPDAKHIT
jgi:hypothetical protein